MGRVENVRVVLVGVQESGNVGMAARAMKNFGLRELYLVAPEADPLAEEARKFAVGAKDVLESARTVDTLDEALADVHFVAATTARARYGYPGKLFTAREAAPVLRGRAEAGERVALVFGRERSGLTNEELDRAHYVIRIPTAPDFKSLNLAQAVLILAYELFLAKPQATEQPRPAAVGELEGFFDDLAEHLIEIGFSDEKRLPHAMRRFRRIFHKAELTPGELAMLRGLLRQGRWAIERERKRRTS